MNPQWNKDAPVVPFDLDGNMLNYPERKFTWERVHDFKSEMKLVNWTRGRSSVTFVLEAEDGCRYPVFASDFYWVVSNRKIDNGRVERTWWTFAKQGANYGLKLL